MNKSSPPHIIIIGAGLCGLNLAQGLKKANVSFTIFERDSSSDFRPQGYRISIDNDGAQGLNRNLTPELWDLFERTCAENTGMPSQLNALDGSLLEGFILTKDGKSFVPKPKPADALGPYVVDRTILRAVLMTGLEENIVYGKSFKQYTITENGVKVHFTDGTTQEGTLLVGADGLRSPVRQQYLPEHHPVDTTGRCIYGKTPLNEKLAEQVHEVVLKSVAFAFDKRHETPLTLLFQPIRFPNKEVPTQLKDKLTKVEDYIFWVLISQQKTFNMEDAQFLKLSNKEAAQLTLDMTKDWVPSLRSIFELQDVSQAGALRLSSFTTKIPVWTPSANVTLIGDAAHVMSPTGGAGANTALKDAANLCRVIVEEGISAESIGKFEEEMRVFVQKKIEGALINAKKLYNQPPFEECKRVEF